MYNTTGDETDVYLNFSTDTIQLQYIYAPLNIFCCIWEVEGIKVCCNSPVHIPLMGKDSN